MGVTKTLPQDAAFPVFVLLFSLALFIVIQLQRLARCAKDVLSSEGKERLSRPKPYLLRELNRRLRFLLYFAKDADFPSDI
ncbi:hypothetical protein BIV59_15300 [Bacillus sp. MUM 13]|nr:hypothetical protein BIV59_15300 [Bacillus sp. MUM 13]